VRLPDSVSLPLAVFRGLLWEFGFAFRLVL
jgi:hypothetical protein